MSRVKPRPMPEKPDKRPVAPRSGLRRTPLKRVSSKKADWNTKYHAAVKAAVEKQKAENDGATYCEKCLADTPNLEPHHPAGQIGEKIMHFKLLGNNFSRCQCHNWVELHKNEARAQGWITYK